MSLPIFMYHNVERSQNSFYTLRLDKFEHQLELISCKGYKSIKLKDIDKIKTNDRFVILTFDDGYDSWVKYVLPALKKYNFQATFFVTVSNLNQAKISIEDLKKISEEGMEIGSHGFSHYSLKNLDPEVLKFELEFSKQYLEEIINEKIVSFSFPHGDYNQKAIKIAHKAGYKYLCTSTPGYFNNGKYLLPRFIIRANISLNDFSKILEHNFYYLSREKFLYFATRSAKKIFSRNIYELVKNKML